MGKFLRSDSLYLSNHQNPEKLNDGFHWPVKPLGTLRTPSLGIAHGCQTEFAKGVNPFHLISPEDHIKKRHGYIRRGDIASLLEDGRPRSFREIADELGGYPKSIGETVRAMAEEGLIKREYRKSLVSQPTPIYSPLDVEGTND